MFDIQAIGPRLAGAIFLVAMVSGVVIAHRKWYWLNPLDYMLRLIIGAAEGFAFMAASPS